MNPEQAILICVRTAESIAEEIEGVYEEITSRAYASFLQRGGIGGLGLEDWLKAERELLVKPVAHVREMDCRIIVTIRIGKVRPADIQILVTPDSMVIQAENRVVGKRIFRTIEFPRRIDVNKAEAIYADGCVILTA